MAGHGSKDYTWDVGSTYTDTPFSLGTPPPPPVAAHGKRPCGGAPRTRRPAGEARCQVEECSAPLAEAKEYHRRHKVCGAHAKAPTAVVRGLQQRFCQQCSRFHVLSAFDDAKRSCRRRLAGHNERRRKDSGGLASLDGAAADRTGFLYAPSSIFPGRALSLLSDEAPVWIPADFSQQSSSALLELMVKSRAAQLPARSLPGHVAAGSHLHTVQELLPASSAFMQLGDEWDQAHCIGPYITLDLMQVPDSPYELLSSRKGQTREEQRSEIWESLGKTRFV